MISQYGAIRDTIHPSSGMDPNGQTLLKLIHGKSKRPFGLPRVTFLELHLKVIGLRFFLLLAGDLAHGLLQCPRYRKLVKATSCFKEKLRLFIPHYSSLDHHSSTKNNIKIVYLYRVQCKHYITLHNTREYI